MPRASLLTQQGLKMEFEEEDRICCKGHYFLDDASARRLSDLITGAPSTTNNDKAKHILMRADTLAYRGYLSQVEKVVDLISFTDRKYLAGLDI